MKIDEIKIIKISDLTKVITGGTPSTKVKDYWLKGNIPWINSGDLNKKIILNADKFITKKGLENCSAKLMPINTILIALTGTTTGVSALLKIEACANQSVTGILPSEKHDPIYLLHYLKYIRDEIVYKSYGGAQKHISQNFVKNLSFPLRNIENQKYISSILDKINNTIEKHKKIMRLYEDFSRNLFKDMFGDIFQNSKNWKKFKLSEKALFENGDRSKNYPSGDEVVESGILFLSTKNIIKNKLNLEDSKFITEQKFNSLKRGKVYKDDLIITLRGTLGSCCIFTEDRAFINAQMMIIRPSSDLDNYYLHALFSGDQMQQYLDSLATGVAVKQLTATQLKNLIIPIPPKDLQINFKKKIQSVETNKHIFKKKLENDINLKKLLETRYFSTNR